MTKVQLRIMVTLSVDYTGAYTGDYNELVYLRARYYAPGMGRFLTRDTWDGHYNSPLTLNRWNYAIGNPINYTDPSGLLPCPWNIYVNTCNIYDYYNWYFGDLYKSAGINSNIYVPSSSGNVSFTGVVTSEYIKPLKPLGETYQLISDVGLGAFPVNPYAWAQALSGTNLGGASLSPNQRWSMAFWGLLGLGDCFPGVRFAPEGIGGGSSAGINTAKYESRFLKAVDDFIRKSLKLHPRTSFGYTWSGWFTAASENAAIANNLILATEGDELVGILRIQNGGREFPNALRLMDIETLNSNASQALLREAAKESLDRGLSGMYGYVTTSEGAWFAERTGAELIGSKMYYWDLETIYKLISH